MMTIPTLLNNAIQSILKRIPTGDQLDLMNMTEEQFTVGSAFSLGMDLRNELGLWKEDSSLAAWFIIQGVTEPDDMSEILLTCVYRIIMARDIDLYGQLEKFRE